MRALSKRFFILTAFVSIAACLCAHAKKKLASEADVAKRPFGPQGAREFAKHLTVADNYEVTLFASEPLLRNPSSIDVDERGRVWVAEIANYGSTRKPWGIVDTKGDRIVILEDIDGDGEADKNSIFYQGHDIDSPYGVCVAGNQVYVGRSPDMFAFTDVDGDGKADSKRPIFTDIGGFDSDHCAHTFVFGPDGKLYFNFGNHAGQLKTPDGKFAVDTEGFPISVAGKKTPGEGQIVEYRHGMSFRCNPDGSELEVLAHNFRNPYELCFDSFGTLFQSDNDDDGNKGTRVVYLMEHGNFGYTDEMTGAGWREARSNIEPEIPKRHWHQNDPGVVPNLVYNGAGAPCGMTVYEGDLMPELRGAILHCDAGPREVRAYLPSPDGAGYKATTKVLVSAEDTWFRPCDVCVGPDGAIYVADWHDGMVGGHDLEDHDLKTMRGRIYRIAPKGFKPSIPKFDFTTAKGCVDALRSPNLATRAKAWIKLHDLGSAAEGDLLTLSTDREPMNRARALQLLGRIIESGQKHLAQALRDREPNVRVTALRIIRQTKGDVIAAVRTLSTDTNPQVRRECALALRGNKSADAAELWATLALQHDGKDRWYLEALGIGADKQWDKFLGPWLLRVGDWKTPAGRDIIWRSRSSKTAGLLSALISDPNTPAEERPRYFRSFDFLDGKAKEAALLNLLTSSAKTN